MADHASAIEVPLAHGHRRSLLKPLGVRRSAPVTLRMSSSARTWTCVSDPSPFSGGPLGFVRNLARLLTAHGPLNWDVARQLAAWTATEAPLRRTPTRWRASKWRSC